jgi:2-methylcitrate dehydratase PrpD
VSGAARTFAEFVVSASPPALARSRAAAAVLDTIGVTLAGASEPAARIVQQVIPTGGPCVVLGTGIRTNPVAAALANGTAAHALDFDDMCFVSLAHPSAPLVPAALAAAELSGASGRALIEAYVVGFEIEARLGRAMNPSHYQRGWHCTSTLGTVGASCAAARLLGLSVDQTVHAICIAASSASGLKENFGSMVKPLHAGFAARDGVVAANLAQHGMTASASAIDGPQGLLHAMDGDRGDLAREMADLGSRWEIVDTGITVKLYPSCAGTHPALDAILDLRPAFASGFGEASVVGDIERVEIGVDAITPTILLYDRPSNGLEGKFSMPFCVAAAIVNGRVGIDTFDEVTLVDPRIVAMMTKITMRVDDTLDKSAPALTQSRVKVRLKDGRELTANANGARGYPERPASGEELAGKFLECARRALPEAAAEAALASVLAIEGLSDVRQLVR